MEFLSLAEIFDAETDARLLATCVVRVAPNTQLEKQTKSEGGDA